MVTMTIQKPQETEFAAFYAGYVGKVPPHGPTALLTDQLAAFGAIGSLSENESNTAMRTASGA